MFGIRRLLRQILERLQVLEESAAASAEKSAQSAETLSQRLAELSGAANRHDLAIEDLLESWEDMQDKQREEQQRLSSSLAEASARERKAAQAREAALLELLLAAHDQLFTLQKAAEAASAAAWERQLGFAEQKLAEARLPVGLQVVEECGVPVNLAVHEPVGIIPTQDAARNRLVAEVDARGYVYLGRVLRKARVSVWKLTDEAEIENKRGESA